MAIPKYNELYNHVLSNIANGEICSAKELRTRIKASLQLSESELSVLLPSGKQTIIDNRISWAITYLKHTELLCAPKRGFVQITKQGKAILEEHIPITNEILYQRFPSLYSFVSGVAPSQGSKTEQKEELKESETPIETLDRVYFNVNAQLADDLLSEIMLQDSIFFERLVVDLMETMNYGSGFVTKASGDGGIDGIIHEDKLGFNLIYVQAKRWNPDTVIGKPEIQKFAGAMMGPPRIEKGLFITTAKFSQGALAFANAQHIILVDGKRLTELMIEYNLGVSIQKKYEIKRIDSDYFLEE